MEVGLVAQALLDVGPFIESIDRHTYELDREIDTLVPDVKSGANDDDGSKTIEQDGVSVLDLVGLGAMLEEFAFQQNQGREMRRDRRDVCVGARRLIEASGQVGDEMDAINREKQAERENQDGDNGFSAIHGFEDVHDRTLLFTSVKS